MHQIRSYVEGRWHLADGGWATLTDPCSEEAIAQCSSRGISFEAALQYAREVGRPALRAMTLGERAGLLAAMSAALLAHRDELIALSLRNTGATRKDAKFDIDGGIYSLSHYAQLGEAMGSRRFMNDGDGEALGRSARFWGQHVLLPREGVAVHINAFNFPVWGFAEKAACALLVGMPVISKPATSSAWVTERAVECIVESAALPVGAFSLICGSTGNLLDLLGPQDVLAFTGSASTAERLRSKANLLAASTRVNIEADSLNAAVLGPGVEQGCESWAVFLRDIVLEMTQKSGQKCTAVRRILVPVERMDEVQHALGERLAEIAVGNPVSSAVGMGPLSSAAQLDEALSGVARLAESCSIVHGTGRRIDGLENPVGKGYFLGPTLLRAADGRRAGDVHEHEVFGPVATLLPYSGSAAEAAELVGLGMGSLVTSLYSNDREFIEQFVLAGGASCGRLYIASDKVAGQLPGSGVAMPQVLHGGPGRAGGGEELGGTRGMALYQQRVALTGDRALIERIVGVR